MNWYCIKPCPKYVISEDGNHVLNTERMTVLHHQTGKVSAGRRVTLYYNKTFKGQTKAYRQAYPLEHLKTFINNDNKVNIDETNIIW